MDGATTRPARRCMKRARVRRRTERQAGARLYRRRLDPSRPLREAWLLSQAKSGYSRRPPGVSQDQSSPGSRRNSRKPESFIEVATPGTNVW
jgi:hypothetical protein